MSCASGSVTFRLLDVNIGWSADPAATLNLTGFTSQNGVALTPVIGAAVDPNGILPYMPPARLARGCGACEWFLVTAAPPASQLLHRDACRLTWHPAFGAQYPPLRLKDAKAVATACGRVAIADSGTGQVWIAALNGTRAPLALAVTRPGPLAFTARGELLVSSSATPAILRYGPDGQARGVLRAPLPAAGVPIIMAVDAAERVWVVLEQQGSWTLWRAGPHDAEFTSGAVVDLANAFPKTELLSAAPAGFCFDEDRRRGLDVETCYTWQGHALPLRNFTPPSPPQLQTQGQMITVPLDSGIARCEWHRVRLDADVPTGTSIVVAVATAEDSAAAPQGNPARDPGWTQFPSGTPHFSDWTSAPSGALDFLIQQPAGRYLYLRLRLTGSGTATPVVRRIRIDFPRATSVDHLPAVYQENPRAAEFSRRFLSLFDASIGDLDDIISRYPALLDPSGVPDQLLPWLGGFFNIDFDPSWDAATRRQILAAAPALYRERGTPAGLILAIQTVFGVTPYIDEGAAIGPWGALASKDFGACTTAGTPPAGAAAAALGTPARVRAVRLFSRARTRLQLNRSTLGAAPLRSHGNPDLDPFSAGANRLTVLVPPLTDRSPQQAQRLVNLVASQTPANTVPQVRIGGSGFLLDQLSVLGIDTTLTPVAAPVLGASGNVRLNRRSVLWPGARCGPGGPILGHNLVVGTSNFAA
jgi:phage tail-like protein